MIGSVSATASGTGEQHAEVQNNHDGDENPQQQQELALREEVGLAGLVDQLGNLPHRAVHRQILQPAIDRQAEEQAENAEQNAEEQQLVAVDAEKRDLRKIRQLQIGFATRRFLRGLCQQSAGAEQQPSRRRGKLFG